MGILGEAAAEEVGAVGDFKEEGDKGEGLAVTDDRGDESINVEEVVELG